MSAAGSNAGWKPPKTVNLSQTDAIGQDADVVMFLYREQAYDPQASPEAEVIIAKHRNGPTGTEKLVFRSHLARFDNLGRGT